MKNFIKTTVAVSALATAAFMSVSARAQISGVAVADPTIAIAKAKALGAGYNQIQTTYDSYIKQIDAKNVEITNFQKQLDSNKDNQISDAELKTAQDTKAPALTSIVAKQNEIDTLRQPIVLAQHYVIENISLQYEAAQQKVVTAKKVGVIVSPEAIVWAPANADITPDITAEIDKAVPAVATTPPANWRPTRQTAAIHQQIQQLLLNSARQQAAQQAAQQPAAPQPQGR
jgi:Skp family chaperone for outer membrane proteins